MKVWDGTANIIHITQITCKFINNAMMTYNTQLNFFRLKVLLQFFVHKNRPQSNGNLIAEITQLPTDCISGYLIFDGKNYSDCVNDLWFSFLAKL